MPYAIRVQTKGTRLFSCICGATGKFTVHPQRARIRCRSCHRTFIIGTAVFEVTSSSTSGPNAPGPADAAPTIPRPKNAREVGNPEGDRGWALDESPESSEESLPNHPRARASEADEPTVMAGIWRSGDPVTVDMPRVLNQLWRERVTGELYIAALTAMGTRYVVQPLSAPDDYSQRTVLGARDWKKAAEKIG